MTAIIGGFSLRRVSDISNQMTSLYVPRVSWLSLWARQNFQVPLKIEPTLSYGYLIRGPISLLVDSLSPMISSIQLVNVSVLIIWVGSLSTNTDLKYPFYTFIM